VSKSKYRFYAVRQGIVPGVYRTWAECELMVKGIKEARYKGFNSLDEAEAYVRGEEEIPNLDINYMDFDAVIYTDGSFNEQRNVYGGAWLMFVFGEPAGEGKVNGRDPEVAKERNNAGELLAVMDAIRFAAKEGACKILIVHDYAGVANFITGLWEPKSPASRAYQAWINKAKEKGIELHFKWVKGHAHNKYNVFVDIAARDAVGLN
jgi:viroplasmin and RNaseH domain-containing protein